MIKPYNWDEEMYLRAYDDVDMVVSNGFLKSGWHHYVKNGRKEGRDPFLKPLSYFAKTHNPNTNYVIATWSGPRRQGNDEYHKDKTFYIRKHLQLLKKVKHHLSQITIVVPRNKKEPKKFSRFLREIPSKIQDAKVVVLRRENYGQSYGSWSHVYGKYRDKFDYYLFVEDDYAFVKDYFDIDLSMRLDSLPNCWFLCCLVGYSIDARLHAAISNGICRSTVLKKVWDVFGELPSGGDYWEVKEDLPEDPKEQRKKSVYSGEPQLQFSEGFLEIGTKLYDVTEDYKIPFNDAGKIRIYGNPKEDCLIVPLQFKELYEFI
jgi:hypothetical protein